MHGAVLPENLSTCLALAAGAQPFPPSQEKYPLFRFVSLFLELQYILLKSYSNSILPNSFSLSQFQILPFFLIPLLLTPWLNRKNTSGRWSLCQSFQPNFRQLEMKGGTPKLPRRRPRSWWPP